MNKKLKIKMPRQYHGIFILVLAGKGKYTGTFLNDHLPERREESLNVSALQMKKQFCI